MAGKFRLLMATQTGQKRARDEGFHSFPVDPFAIAAKHDIDEVAGRALEAGFHEIPRFEADLGIEISSGR